MKNDENEGSKPGASIAAGARYEVGYGKPPTRSRFQKGRSGNPGGRPKGVKNRPRPMNPANQPTDSLILEEAYRPVTIREGDRTIELPAIQAAMRALAISAMKGSRLSQKTLAEVVREVEDRHARERTQMLEGALDYKLKWNAEIERCEKLGIEVPRPIPDPDDIVINFRTGEVKTEGPLDEREKASYDERIARRTEAQAEVSYFAERYGKARHPKQKARWLEEWHFEQRIFDLINDGMPRRYKAELASRSYKQGASKAGKTLQEFVEDRRRPQAARRWGDYCED
jgi:hypothetical protein